MAYNLVNYVTRSTNANLDKYLQAETDLYRDEWDVVLIDDPPDTYSIKRFLTLAEKGQIKLLILGFDPLQLDESVTDTDYQELTNRAGVRVFSLSNCYRQKENVGKATKKASDVIAESTPFLDKQKILDYQAERSHLTQLANNLIFRNPYGYTQIYENSRTSDVNYEIDRICKEPWLLWKHWFNLLVIEPDEDSLHPDCYQAFQRLDTMHITLDEIHKIKGLEFQHVFLFIPRSLYDEIEFGFKGSGQRTYNQRRLLRIPFSRAKDSLVIFILE